MTATPVCDGFMQRIWRAGDGGWGVEGCLVGLLPMCRAWLAPGDEKAAAAGRLFENDLETGVEVEVEAEAGVVKEAEEP